MGLVFSSYNVVDEFQLLYTVSMSQVASRLGDLESGNGSGTLATTRPCQYLTTVCRKCPIRPASFIISNTPRRAPLS